jgi:hypothetical protein
VCSGTLFDTGEFILDELPHGRFQIQLVDSDPCHSLGQNRGLSRNIQFLVDEDDPLRTEDAEAPFKFPLFEANGDAAVESKLPEFLEELIVGHRL